MRWEEVLARGESGQRRASWRRGSASSSSTTRSTSSTPPARPASPRARRSRTTRSSTTASSSASGCASPSATGSASRCPSTTASGWCWATWPASPTARRWSSRRRSSTRGRRWRRSQAERCTALHGVPTMFIAELGDPEFARFDLSTLRTGIMAGSPCPVEVMKQVVDADAHGRGDDLLRHDRDLAGLLPDARPTTRSRSGSATVGRVHPHVECKIVDPATGAGRAARRRRASCSRAATS